ncbi:YsnF/AvaK domain-containing protein [Flaviaesturariibacter aridisoli]|uniref:DUF2382 domain-containing protein n=1 Tax=Flaviaesturariibacter aridisoli TaxID=2545761 RepID=A0A4R4E7Q8_9BACT|nr:YsnF/AvaK domain-containing protein [Flaviaesturariibacter aridisoli]TCZ74963.1 DUF2382 domain-containing protein [Flaviaesturariibacter aridisoli]
MENRNEWRAEPGNDGTEEQRPVQATGDGEEIVIPVIQEFMTVEKEVVETGRVTVRKTVREEEAALNIPLVSEQYDVKRVAKSDVYLKPPVPRQEGDTIIVPVVKEILVIEKRYEVTEEVHLTKRVSTTPHVQQITLLKEQVDVIRTDAEGNKRRL